MMSVVTVSSWAVDQRGPPPPPTPPGWVWLSLPGEALVGETSLRLTSSSGLTGTSCPETSEIQREATACQSIMSCHKGLC